MTKEFNKLIKPLIVLFILMSLLILGFKSFLLDSKIDIRVVLWANVLLLVVSVLNLFFQYKQINNPNPNVVVRGIMVGMFLKLFGLGAAVMIYLIAAGEYRSVNAVFGGMGLYILYTWVEVRISLRLNPKK